MKSLKDVLETRVLFIPFIGPRHFKREFRSLAQPACQGRHQKPIGSLIYQFGQALTDTATSIRLVDARMLVRIPVDLGRVPALGYIFGSPCFEDCEK